MKRSVLSSRFAWLTLALSILIIAPVMLLGPTIEAQNGPQYRASNNNYGVSGGNVNDATRRFCCSGTLGSLVQDNQGVQYILSNNHVVGLAGQAVAGQDISQPGLIDSNCQVAEVVADFTVAAGLNTNVDAAIAQLRPGAMNSTGAIEGIGTISSTVRTPAVGLAVQKSGRTTGHTTGTIGAINATVSIRYPKTCGGGGGTVFTFTNQVVINSSTFSAGGDSGSLIVTNDSCRQPVALLFAGSSSSTIGNRATDVISRLSTALGRPVSFVGGACGTAARFEPGRDLPGLSEVALARATTIKERNENRIMSRPAVIGFGVTASDTDASQAVLVVYIDQTRGVHPRIPRTLGGMPVKVVYTDTFVAF